jgi:hypothetical protein
VCQGPAQKSVPTAIRRRHPSSVLCGLSLSRVARSKQTLSAARLRSPTARNTEPSALTLSISGSRCRSIASRSISACDRLLMSSDVHAKCVNSRTCPAQSHTSHQSRGCAPGGEQPQLNCNRSLTGCFASSDSRTCQSYKQGVQTSGSKAFFLLGERAPRETPNLACLTFASSGLLRNLSFSTYSIALTSWLVTRST